jgi:hypothetical protein
MAVIDLYDVVHRVVEHFSICRRGIFSFAMVVEAVRRKSCVVNRGRPKSFWFRRMAFESAASLTQRSGYLEPHACGRTCSRLTVMAWSWRNRSNTSGESGTLWPTPFFAISLGIVIRPRQSLYATKGLG